MALAGAQAIGREQQQQRTHALARRQSAIANGGGDQIALVAGSWQQLIEPAINGRPQLHQVFGKSAVDRRSRIGRHRSLSSSVFLQYPNIPPSTARSRRCTILTLKCS